jgi:GT2 family glycosyltransferase
MLLILLFAPVDWILMCVLLCAELVGRLWKLIAPLQVPSFPLCRHDCSFVIVSWHGKSSLAQSLPALLQAARLHGGDHEVIVVLDHESNDGTRDLLRKDFPEVTLLQAQTSLYFGAATRLGIQKATRDVVVLINNDTIVDEDFLAPLLKRFEDPAVFGVASQVRASSGQARETGKTRAYFQGGDIVWAQEGILTVEDSRDYCPVSWLHRGAMALDRRKYLWLLGLDDLYDPGYFEDADLSHRAWKVGWKCLLAMNSRVSHEHQFKVPRGGAEFIHLIVRRNAYVFFWKNIYDVPMMMKHCLTSVSRRRHRARVSGISPAIELRSFLAALERVPVILKKRLFAARTAIQTDREIFELVTRCQQGTDVLASQFEAETVKEAISQISKFHV